MPCVLCELTDKGTMILMPSDSRWPHQTFHALCIDLMGGELKQQACALWKRLGHTDTWDTMIRAEKGGGD